MSNRNERNGSNTTVLSKTCTKANYFVPKPLVRMISKRKSLKAEVFQHGTRVKMLKHEGNIVIKRKLK